MQDASPSTVKTPDFPMVDIPRFEASAAQATTAFREFAEKGISQAKDNYAKMKTAAEEATSMLETTYANASKGAADYGLKMVEMARVNSNARDSLTVCTRQGTAVSPASRAAARRRRPAISQK